MKAANNRSNGAVGVRDTVEKQENMCWGIKAVNNLGNMTGGLRGC